MAHTNRKSVAALRGFLQKYTRLNKNTHAGAIICSQMALAAVVSVMALR